jgi:hypothetical protein
MWPRGYTITRVITPAASLSLVTVADAKTAIGLDPTDTSQDATLQRIIDSVSSAISQYCDRIFVRQTYRDQLRSVCTWLDWGQELLTRQWPIPLDGTGVPVLAVTENGTLLDPSLFEVNVETGAVWRFDDASNLSGWTATPILIDYDAGYDVVPSDVQGAALEWLTGRWFAIGQDPALRSETIPDVIASTWDKPTTSGSSLPATVRDWLAPYRRSFV